MFTSIAERIVLHFIITVSVGKRGRSTQPGTAEQSGAQLPQSSRVSAQESEPIV